MYRPVTVREIIEKSVERFRYNCAFTFLDSEGKKAEISYKQLKRDIDSFSLSLIYEYKLKGKKAAIISCNCYEWCVAYLACLCSGIVAVPVDRELAGEDIEAILRFAAADTVICDSHAFSKLKGMAGFRFICIQDSENGFYPLLERGRKLLLEGFSTGETPDPEKLAVLLFTSGTTGNPKGVMLSNANLCSDLYLVRENIRVGETDRSLSLLPLHHTYEAMALLMMLYCGGSIAFCGGIRYLGKSFSVFSPTVFVTVPLVLERLHKKITDEIEQQGKRQKLRLASLVSSAMSREKRKRIFSDIHTFFGSRLKNIVVGAATLQQSVAEDFELFGFNVIIGYGLTECSPIVICNSVEERTSDTVGRPLKEVQLKIDRPDEKGVGEILVKGPMVMLGYYKNKAATDEVFRDGWFCTGDLGFKDKNGRYRISGRSKNVIVTKNGKNIYPEELEYRLNKSPYISESLVFSEKGEVVSCEVVADEDAVKAKLGRKTATDEEIKAIINEVVRSVNRMLPSYKRIKKVSVIKDGFSKTTTHKIKRKN